MSTLTTGRREGLRRHCPGFSTILRGMCQRHQACLMPDSIISYLCGAVPFMAALSSKAVNGCISGNSGLLQIKSGTSNLEIYKVSSIDEVI